MKLYIINRPNTKKAKRMKDRYIEKRRIKSPLKHFSGLKNLKQFDGQFLILTDSTIFAVFFNF